MMSPIETLFEAAKAAQDRGELPHAALLYTDLLAKAPAHGEALNNLGNIMLELGHADEALACFEKALESDPHLHIAAYNQARLYQMMGRLAAAEAAYTALLKNEFLPEAAYNLAILRRAQGRMEAASIAYTALLEKCPHHAHAWNNLGKLRREVGDIAGAMHAFKRAVQAAPDDAEITSNLLFCALHDETLDSQGLFALTAAFGARFDLHGDEAPRGNTHTEPHLPNPVRIGFVSGDFCAHPVAYFLHPLLTHLDRARVVPILFSNTPEEDAWSARLKGEAAEWHPIRHLDDRRAVELIRTLKIDVLVDLSGHTAGNRLGVFRHQPAPLLLTWLGYLGSTGLSALDYRITDRFCDPPAALGFHTESLAYLPQSQWCYAPPEEYPLSSVDKPLKESEPSLRLGVFSSTAKLSTGFLKLCQTLLARLPHALLFIGGIPEGPARERIEALFSEVPALWARLKFIAPLPLDAYFHTLQGLDIALDTFPYGGGTTSCDMLWMGTPVVSLSGVRSAARSGVSILSTVGLSDWIAEDVNAYADIVEYWGQAPEKLSALKRGLRDKMKASPLCDAKAFATDWLGLIENLWENKHKKR